MGTEEAKKLIDELAEMGVMMLVFSGGEPLLRKDLFDLAKCASLKGVIPGIGTNGTLIDNEAVEKLENSGVRYLLVSLDGASPETHDRVRGVPGAFNKAVSGIKASINAGLPVITATTIMKSNYKEIPAILELSAKLNAVMFNTFGIIPCGRGMGIFQTEDVTPQEREELLNHLYRKSQELRGKIVAGRFDYTIWSRVLLTNIEKESPVAYQRVLQMCKAIGGCSAGRWRASITPDGVVWPCSYLPKDVGNVREKSFREIWFESEVLKDLRNIEKIKSACGSCKFRDLCRGCRSRAYAYTGDYHAADLGCIISGG